MTFTDDDLKRLKSDVQNEPKTAEYLYPAHLFKRLIARLEAAENFIRSEKRGICCVHTDGNKCQMAIALKTWREAAGKHG